MKKMVFMAAFVAATAAFVACSSNDDLVQQKPEVPEEMVDEGTPMKIIVSDLATRGTDFSSTNPLTGFKLYSTLDSYWTAGKLFGKDSGGNWTTNNTLTWPDDDAEHTFFAINVVEDTEFADIAENSGEGDNNPDLPTVGAETCSFNYKMPQTYDNAKEEYYYNSENLKDLLVAKSSGGRDISPTYGETTYPKGSVFVNFSHALAQIIKIKVFCNSAKLKSEGDAALWHFRVNSIKIGGIKAIGTYTFSTTSTDASWAVSGDDAEFVIPLDISTNVDEAFAATTFVPGDKNSAIELKMTDGGFYMIPQEVTSSMTQKPGPLYELSGAYAELELQSAQIDPETPDDVIYYCWDKDVDFLDLEDGWNAASSTANGFLRVRVPLVFDISDGSGKGYSLLIDISKGISQEANTFNSVGSPVLGSSIDIQV